MIHIAPAILTSDLMTFESQAQAFTQFAKRIQLDIVDGDFAPMRTIRLDEIKELPQSAEIAWDIHMMVSRPSEHLDEIIRLKPSLCIFHAEVNEKLLPIFEELKKHEIKVGLAILQPTFPGNLTNLIKIVDHVLIFAGNLGQQGGVADLLQTEKVGIIKGINPEVEVGWDGGVNLGNIRTIAHSGLSVVNVGSAISRSNDPLKAFKELNAEADRPGVLI